MKKVIVPKDVRKRARRTLYSRLANLAFLLTFAYVIIDYIYEGLKTTNFGNLSATIFLILIVPFWISGVPIKLMEPDWYGKIIMTELENNDPAKVDNHSVPPISVKVLVRTSDGKLYEREVFDEGEFFYGERERVYKEGDRVVHVRWTDYLMPVRDEKDDRPVACVICGNKSKKGSKSCRCCGSSLCIKVIDVKNEIH